VRRPAAGYQVEDVGNRPLVRNEERRMDDGPQGEFPIPREVPLAMTYEEFLAIPTPTQAEWVDGVCVVFRPQRRDEAFLKLWLASLLSQYVERFDLGEVLIGPFEMSLRQGRSAREPDIVFIANGHADRLTEDRLEGPADLVVEIVSEDSADRDYREKVHEYEAAGIPEYWIVDARLGEERSVFYHLGAAGRYRLPPLDDRGRYHSAVLPGFWLDPVWLWPVDARTPLALIETIAPGTMLDALLDRRVRASMEHGDGDMAQNTTQDRPAPEPAADRSTSDG
jgi:Uma2 family endonuclease